MDPTGDLSPEEFRRYGREVVDWIADYLEGIRSYPVLARTRPGEIAAALPVDPPMKPVPLEETLREFRETLIPGITHWNHPRFFAYFSITGSAPGILGELLAAALNVNAMLWRTSPAATELETVVLGWLRRMLGLPESFDGHINDTASVSTLVALAAARQAATQGAVRERGLVGGPRLRLYTSEEAHSSVEKAALTLGLGQQGVRKIPTDEAFRMDVAALTRAVAEDRRAGWIPMAVSATVGTTSTTSIDPIPAIADLCQREGIWLHVDGAYGGAMAAVPEYRWVLEGCDRADSFVMNPHKWLYVPIDLSALYCRRPEVIREAFSLVPPYLMTPEEGTARNLMDYGPALGRRFRALKLWMVLRTFGTEGIAARIRAAVDMARAFAAWVDEASDWERLAPAPMSTVLFRHLPPAEVTAARAESAGSGELAPREPAIEAHNRALLETVNASGRAFLSHVVVRGKFGLRLAVGNVRTAPEDVAETWALLRETAAALR
jgi:aromatic-L-amino-acid decarboxylase